MKKATIKEIFKEHFEHFWKENAGKFPEDEREHIREEQEILRDWRTATKK